MEILTLLALLQIKHWYVDFPNQSTEEIAHKGIYGHWLGIKHSLKHGIGTLLVLLVVGIDAPTSFALSVVEGVIHYHIDWFKMNKGSQDISTPEFWNHLGLDQMAHQLTYLAIVGMLII